MRQVAIIDASVLFSASLRDLLLRLAVNDLFQAKWTEEIHREWMEAVLNRREDIPREQLERTRLLMDSHINDALVEGYEAIIGTLSLPDLNDRHVLAAAIKGQANVIITHNLKDFPPEILSAFNIEAQSPDTFLSQLVNNHLPDVLATMQAHRQVLTKPPKTAEEYIQTLEKQGLIQTAGIVRRFIGVI